MLSSLFVRFFALVCMASVPHHVPVSQANGYVFPADIDKGLGLKADAKDAFYVPHLMLDDEINGSTVDKLIGEINQANTDHASSILIEIDSPGGSVMDGMRLQKVIERSEAPVVCVIDGMAASMAFSVEQSCSVRAMTSRSFLMMHEPSGQVAGQPTKVSNGLALMKVLTNAMIEHCRARTNMSFADFKSKIIDGREFWVDHFISEQYHITDLTVPSVASVEKALKQGCKLIP